MLALRLLGYTLFSEPRLSETPLAPNIEANSANNSTYAQEDTK
ncbi:hypothetical protein CEV33_2282 [Brucella grignonensis]|uniref:Uncharacterized protein n=1 Tax=Brucella grignonensis TaxID=94627 RepID=A0A256F7Y1_9HYPH|nr:hypothetical protein CEV33_2282 [Brucella grignonensis]